jgi:3-oxoacyl-[acyl-carrier protein] reductase
MPQEMQQMIIDDSPLKRLGTPQDVAALVSFLVSDEGGWVNGQNILVNGGCPF